MGKKTVPKKGGQKNHKYEFKWSVKLLFDN